jgi:hypothetical protein
VSIKGRAQGFTRQLPGAMASHDHDIPSHQLVLMQPKTFPAGPFEAIARHCIACGFDGYREPEAGVVQAIRTGQDHQTGIILTMAFRTQGGKLAGPGQASRWREAPLSHAKLVDQTVRR